MMSQALPHWPLEKLLAGVVEHPRLAKTSVSGISMDSRRLSQGDLFLACQGTTGHGLDYLDQVIAADASAVVYEPGVGAPDETVIPLIPVAGLREKAGMIADRFYEAPSARLQVIAVTGTNGKTSVSHYIAQALHGLSGKCGLIGTLGNGLYGDLSDSGYTTPDVVTVHQTLNRFVELGSHYAVMEVSSHALDQGRVDAVRFEIAVFTNLSRDHLDYHGDMHSYAEAKRRLFHWNNLQAAVINADDPTGAQWLESLPESVAPLAYSLRGPVSNIATVYATKIDYSLSGIRLNVASPYGEAVLETALLGRFNAENLLAAFAVLLQLGFDLEDAVRQVNATTPVSGRMQQLGGGKYPLVVVDYAHTPDALEQALEALKPHVVGRLVCVFGCGGQRDQGKRPLMGEVAERCADAVIITNDNPRNENPEAIIDQILKGVRAEANVQVVPDRQQAIVEALAGSTADDVVLIAGKGHETGQIIGDTVLDFNDADVVISWLESVQ